MSVGRRYLVLIAIVAACGLPAAGAYLHFRVTDNPLLQPLGITSEKLAEFDGQGQFVAIVVQVDWGVERRGRPPQLEFRQLLQRAFMAPPENLIFRFRNVPGTDIRVRYVVGPNRFGPYPPERAVDGIVPASEALAMTRAFRARMDAAASPSR